MQYLQNWSLYDDGENEDSSHIIITRIEEENYNVAYMAADLPADQRTECAKLIEAAPELLKSLQFAVSFIKNNIAQDSQPRGIDKWEKLTKRFPQMAKIL